MAGTALLGRLTWQLAELVEVVAETPRVKTIVFDVPGWPGHRAGQHVDVRLTAEDGYQAERSYSIASAPDGTRVALTVQRLEDGEVSPYLTDELRPGDKIELRGPIGGYFVWEPSERGPLMLVAGGSGIVPRRGTATALRRTYTRPIRSEHLRSCPLLRSPARHRRRERFRQNLAFPDQRRANALRCRAALGIAPGVTRLADP
jgi:ferredoxin-NADP reductase